MNLYAMHLHEQQPKTSTAFIRDLFPIALLAAGRAFHAELYRTLLKMVAAVPFAWSVSSSSCVAHGRGPTERMICFPVTKRNSISGPLENLHQN